MKVVISIGGHTSVVPLKVTPGIVEVSCSVIPPSVEMWGPVPSVGAAAATPAPMRTAARPSIRSGEANFRTIAGTAVVVGARTRAPAVTTAE